MHRVDLRRLRQRACRRSREDGNLVLGPPTTRRWAYAVSKLYDEHVALALAEERGLRVSILRLFGSYGPHNHPSWWGGPQSAFIETLLDGGVIDIHGDGQQVRTFTYVSDTVDGFVRTLRTPEARGEVINIGGTQPTTILNLATAVHEVMGIGLPLRARFLPYEALPGKYQDVRMRIPDTAKARRILDFTPRIPLHEGLELTLAWHRERRAALLEELPRMRCRSLILALLALSVFAPAALAADPPEGVVRSRSHRARRPRLDRRCPARRRTGSTAARPRRPSTRP